MAEPLLEQMRRNPRDWRIGEVERLCGSERVDCSAPRKGSHYKVRHAAMAEILTIPAHRPIKPVYIRALVRFIDAVRETSA